MLRTLSRVAGALAAATVGVLVLSSPASAATRIGEYPNFAFGCDASVYITDTLIGSPGKIEAWGGWVCPSGKRWGGVLTITVYRNNSPVKTVKANYGYVSTGHVDATLANTSGSQSWRAVLRLDSPASATVFVNTGSLSS